MNPSETRIVVADEHFLYLPLYYAEHKNFFDLLPPGSQIKIVRSRKHTDESAFDMLMDEDMSDNKGIDFAVCDPACTFVKRRQNTHPAVIAGLLTNSAFWAVNHKANRVKFIDQLASFDKIISFKEGTTSFGIAKRIFHAPERSASILKVDPNQELTLLNADIGRNTVALSPDIVGIQQLLENKGDMFGIELALADTAEYHDMLVTAVLTRRDVVEGKREFVRALLKAIQTALVCVRSRSPEVIAFAAERFSHKESTVRSALVEADRADVYPRNIKVSQAAWMKVGEIAACSRGKIFDDSAREAALHDYLLLVEPYTHFATAIVNDLESATIGALPLISREKRIELAAAAIPTGAMLLLLLACSLLTDAALFNNSLVFVLVFLVLTVGLAKVVKIRPWTLSGLIYWLQLASGALAGIALMNVKLASQVVQRLPGIDSGFTLPTSPLWLTILASLIATLRHVNTELARRRGART